MTGQDERAELARLAESILSGAAAPGRDDTGTGFDAELWKTLDGAGLTRITLPDAAGGSGGDLVDAAAVLVAAGAHAARVPLVETDLLGGWLLHRAGLEVPAGPLTAVVGELTDADDGLRGRFARVPWTRAAAGLVVLSGSRVLLLDPARCDVVDGTNLAEEPRDAVTVAGPALATADLAAQGDGEQGDGEQAAEELRAEFRLRAALGRSLLLAGAARGALAAAVGYAGERVQFGRPIGKLQAVQQQLALAAAEVAAASAASASAAAAVTADGWQAPSARFAVGAAKARTGEAAGAVARIAHQVHGAMGFTREHDLRLVTTRLWAWRDEDGSDAEWNAELGALALAAGRDGLWPLITGTP